MVEEVGGIITALGTMALWLQAVGVVVILWIIFEIVALYYTIKRMKEVYAIKGDVKRIEGKIDSLLKKR